MTRQRASSLLCPNKLLRFQYELLAGEYGQHQPPSLMTSTQDSTKAHSSNDGLTMYGIPAKSPHSPPKAMTDQRPSSSCTQHPPTNAQVLWPASCPLCVQCHKRFMTRRRRTTTVTRRCGRTQTQLIKCIECRLLSVIVNSDWLSLDVNMADSAHPSSLVPGFDSV